MTLDTQVRDSVSRLTVRAGSDSLGQQAFHATAGAGQQTHHEWIADDWGWLNIVIEGEPDRAVGRTRLTVGPPPSQEKLPPPALTEEQVAERAAERERAESRALASARASLLAGYTLRQKVDQLEVERPLSLTLQPGTCYLWHSDAETSQPELKILDARRQISSRVGRLSNLTRPFCAVRKATATVLWPKDARAPGGPFRIEVWEKRVSQDVLQQLTENDRQTHCRTCREQAVVCFQRGDPGCERGLGRCVEDHGLGRDACN